MKKMLIALTAAAGFSGSAYAADLPARMPMKAAPLPVPVASWTGCYVAGGGGYGMYNAETQAVVLPAGTQVADQGTGGGRGWMGQGQVGCDYQFAGPLGNWVIGAFGDYTFSNVHGRKIGPPATLSVGDFNENWSWAFGGRIGYLVTPTFLTYFSGGYTETHFNQINYTNSLGPPFGIPTNFSLPGSTYQGWFLGSGFEYAIGFLSGLYLKSEYRFSEFDQKTINNTFTNTGLPIVGSGERVKIFTQSVMTSLVYRFNWGGPVVAKY